MSVELSGKNTSVVMNFLVAVVLLILSIPLFYFGTFMTFMGGLSDDDITILGPILILVGAFFGLILFLYPATKAMNVSSKIDIINEYNTSEKTKPTDKIAIAHPQRTLVVLLTFVSPFLAFVPWLAALWIVSGTFRVKIPDDIAANLNLTKLNLDNR